jgi:hypothetical protein
VETTKEKTPYKWCSIFGDPKEKGIIRPFAAEPAGDWRILLPSAKAAIGNKSSVFFENYQLKSPI